MGDDGRLPAGQTYSIPTCLFNAAPNVNDDSEKYEAFFSLFFYVLDNGKKTEAM